MKDKVINTKVNRIVNDLRWLNVTSEELELIIDKVGMTEQIMKQLVIKADNDKLIQLLNERQKLNK